MALFDAFFFLIWLVPCALALLALRHRRAPWSLSLLSGPTLALIIGAVGAPPDIQMPVVLGVSLSVFAVLDVLQLRARQAAERQAAQSGLSLEDYLRLNPHLYAKTGIRPPRKARVGWFQCFRRAGHTQRATQAGNPVEVLMPSQRVVLCREADTKGFWMATAASGEVRVYIPPGVQTYEGLALTVVTKPNGTLMGL